MARRGAKLGTSVLDLDIDDSRFHGKLSGARRAAEQFTSRTGKSLVTAGNAIAGVGSSMTRNLTLPILAAGGAVAKMGLDFDTTLRRVVGLTDVTQEQIAGIREELLKLGPEVGKSPQELAEAFYFVASAGFSGAEAMEVLKIAAKSAASGLGDTQSIAQVLGSVINAYGKENITAARAADILTEAISQGTAEAPEFAAVIGRVTPIAASLGVAFEEVAAAIAGMTLTGLSADESATALRQVLVSLLKPTAQAEEAMSGLGLSSAELREQLREEGLLSTLRTLEERFAGNDEAASAVFGNIRALAGVTSLLTLDTGQLNDIFAKVEDSLGRQEQGYKDTEGPQRDLDRSMAQLSATAIELGTDVLPLVVEVLGEIAQMAKGLSRGWNSLDDGTKQLIIRSLAFVAVAGPVLIVVGKLTVGAGMLFKAIGFLIGPAGVSALTARFAGLGLVVRGLLGPLGLLLVAAEGIKFALNEATDGGYDMERAFLDAAQETGDFTGALREADEAANRAGISHTKFRDLVVAAMRELGLSWEEAIDHIVENADRVEQKAVGLPPKLEGAFEKVPGIIEKPFEEGADGAVSAVDKMYSDIAAAIAERENALRQAGGDAVKAWLDPQVWASQLEAVNAEIVSADAVLAEELRANREDIQSAREKGDADALAAAQRATDEIVRDHERRTIELTAEAIELETNLALTGTRMEQAAKLSALRQSDFMLTGLASEDEEIAAVFQGWAASLDAELDSMLDLARRSGPSIPSLLASGIYRDSYKARDAIADMAQSMRAVMPSSEPKDPSSPLRGITDAWGFNTTLAGGLRDIRPITAAMGDVAGAMRLSPIATPGLSGLGAASYSGAFDRDAPYRGGEGGGTTLEGGIHITAPTVPMTPRDIGRELRRTGVFGLDEF